MHETTSKNLMQTCKLLKTKHFENLLIFNMMEMNVYLPSSVLTENSKFLTSSLEFPSTYIYFLLECSFFCIGAALQALSRLSLSLSFHLKRPKRK